MRVDLRRVQGMAKEFLNEPDVDALLEQMGSCGAACAASRYG